MNDTFPEGLVDHWQDLLVRDRQRVRLDESGVCEAVFEDPVVFPLQRKRELAKVLDLLKPRKPITVCEIGADKGGTLLHWCLLPTVRNVIACEVRGTPYKEVFRKAFPWLNFCWIEESSRSDSTRVRIQQFLRDFSPEGIDVVFLDGEKARFYEDFVEYKKYLLPQCAVALFHDITDEPTDQAYAKVCQRYRHQEVVDISESEAATAREMQGVPAMTSHENWLRVWRGKSARFGVVYVHENKVGAI